MSASTSQPDAAPCPEEEDKDCVLCYVFKQGVCKPEFEAFDRCFDTATAAGADGERRCQGLFTSFRTCFDKRMLAEKLMKSLG